MFLVNAVERFSCRWDVDSSIKILGAKEFGGRMNSKFSLLLIQEVLGICCWSPAWQFRHFYKTKSLWYCSHLIGSLGLDVTCKKLPGHGNPFLLGCYLLISFTGKPEFYVFITVFCLQVDFVDHRPICKYFRSQIYITCLYLFPLESFAGSRDIYKAV